MSLYLRLCYLMYPVVQIAIVVGLIVWAKHQLARPRMNIDRKDASSAAEIDATFLNTKEPGWARTQTITQLLRPPSTRLRTTSTEKSILS